jgi:hypothetical protein
MERQVAVLKRIANRKVVHQIVFAPGSISKVDLVSHPWVLFPWLSNGKTDVKPNHKQSNIQPQTYAHIHCQLVQEFGSKLGARPMSVSTVIE